MVLSPYIEMETCEKIIYIESISFLVLYTHCFHQFYMLFSPIFVFKYIFPTSDLSNWVLLLKAAYIGARNKLEYSGHVIDTHVHVLSFTWAARSIWSKKNIDALRLKFHVIFCPF